MKKQWISVYIKLVGVDIPDAILTSKTTPQPNVNDDEWDGE